MRFIKPIIFIVIISIGAIYFFWNLDKSPERDQHPRTSKHSIASGAKLTVNDFTASGIENLLEITNILETLKLKPSDPETRLNLFKHIQVVDDNQGSREIVAGLKSVYSLVQVGVGEKNGFALCEFVRENYADTGFAPLVEPAQFYETCKTCSGNGNNPDLCQTCRGNGNCAICLGKGSQQVNQRAAQHLEKRSRVRQLGDAPKTVTVDVKCQVCDGSGICSSCKGTGRRVTSCRDCGGTGKVFSKIRVKAVFDQ